MKTRNVAVVIFYDNNKRILLQDRRGISKLGEEYGFFGGEIDKGETPEQAIVRETKEELDFDLKEYKYVGEYSYEIKDSLKKKFANFDFDIVLCKVFIAPLDDPSKFKQKEGKNMRLFSLDEAEKLKMVSNGDIEIVRKLKKVLKLEEKVVFYNDKKQKLVGILDLPNKEKPPIAIIVHGSNDKEVSPKQSEELFKMANEPKDFILIEAGEHVLTRNSSSRKKIIQLSLEWFNKWLK